MSSRSFPKKEIGIGFVGCGYAGDLYIGGIRKYPHLKMIAVTDRDQRRLAEFGAYYSVKTCAGTDALLAEPSVQLVVNLTNPDSHFAVSKACLEAGKHVYSEKPLTMTMTEADELGKIAKSKGLHLSAAPCGVLGETAQMVWRSLRSGKIGKVCAVYAELDDGPIQMREPQKWRTASGARYPYQDEFSVGVTLEHAGYYLAWFAAYFGPARSITAFASIQWPDKTTVPDTPIHATAPDLSVACITFESGVVVRLTNSLLGPHNHEARFIGDKGVITVVDCWNYSSPVYWDRYSKRRLQINRFPILRNFPFVKNWFAAHPRELPPLKKVSWKKRYSRHRQDFARGVADLGSAILNERKARLPTDFCLHVNEMALAIQTAVQFPYQMQTSFEPLEPMDDVALNPFLELDW